MIIQNQKVLIMVENRKELLLPNTNRKLMKTFRMNYNCFLSVMPSGVFSKKMSGWANMASAWGASL
jgi:hypothetical protein